MSALATLQYLDSTTLDHNRRNGRPPAEVRGHSGPPADARPSEKGRPVHILLVEDNPGDVRLIMEALCDFSADSRVNVVKDGEEALAYLRGEDGYAGASLPDLILLDLNLPRKDGREVLLEIKASPLLSSIPVVVLTTSRAESDVRSAYDAHANCYITKPGNLDHFVEVVKSINGFWFGTARLPDCRAEEDER